MSDCPSVSVVVQSVATASVSVPAPVIVHTTVSPTAPIVTVVERPIALARVVSRAPVVANISQVGAQGPAGPQGPSGSITYLRTAAQALSGHRVVRTTDATHVDYCDANTISHLDSLLGITTGAASAGATATVAASGELSDGAWTWTPGAPIFCGANGTLTQTYDNTRAWTRIVAFASSATTIVIQMREPMEIH